MTDPFETEVAKVLASLAWPDGNGWTVHINWPEAEALAPRVAAAIAAAAAQVHRNDNPNLGAEYKVTPHVAALAALRGQHG